LLQALAIGMVEIAVHPPRCVSRPSARPVVSPLARLQAGGGRLVTNLRHQPVELNPLARRVVHRLDGSHDRRSLLGCVEESVAAGELTVKAADRAVKQLEPQAAAEILDRTLSHITASALLIN
jgi:hypothetical protein